MAILDLRSNEGKYGGSAKAVRDLLQNLGQFEQGRREMSVQEAALRALSEPGYENEEPGAKMARVNNAALTAYGNPSVGKGVQGAMRSVFGRFAPSQSPTISAMAGQALQAIAPLNAVQRVQKQYYESLAQRAAKAASQVLIATNEETGEQMEWKPGDDIPDGWILSRPGTARVNRAKETQDIIGNYRMLNRAALDPKTGEVKDPELKTKADQYFKDQVMPRLTPQKSKTSEGGIGIMPDWMKVKPGANQAIGDAGTMGPSSLAPVNITQADGVGTDFGTGAKATREILSRRSLVVTPQPEPAASLESDVAWTMASPGMGLKQWGDAIRQRGGDDEDIRKLESAIRSGNREWVTKALAMLR